MFRKQMEDAVLPAPRARAGSPRLFRGAQVPSRVAEYTAGRYVSTSRQLISDAMSGEEYTVRGYGHMWGCREPRSLNGNTPVNENNMFQGTSPSLAPFVWWGRIPQRKKSPAGGDSRTTSPAQVHGCQYGAGSPVHYPNSGCMLRTYYGIGIAFSKDFSSHSDRAQ